MNAARRNANRRGWPRGLYEPREGYYVWRSPEGPTIPIGRVSLAGAKAQAAAANLKAESMAPSLLEKMAPADDDGQTVEALLGKIPQAKAANTRRSHKSLDKRIVAAIGSMQAADLRTQHCAELIEPIEAVEKKARLALAVRSRLVTMCQRGMQLGWMTSNPAEATRTPAVEVKRQRLSLDAFKAVRARADDVNGWLGKAMDLALVTGADRDTISGLERRANVVDDCLQFRRGKTGVLIAIPLDLELVAAGLVLRQVVKNTSGVASRFIVHHVRNFGNAPAGSRVFVDTISKAFTAAYRLTELPQGNAPTFHEIRSLSKRLYAAQGNVDTKALLGHQDEKTAALYADPRGSEAIRVTVKPLPANKQSLNTK